MKHFILLLYFLGHFCDKVVLGNNSTQVYYVMITIEKTVSKCAETLLGSFQMDSPVKITNPTVSTDCDSTNGPEILCTCRNGTSWSDEVCAQYPLCCKKDNCTFENSTFNKLKRMCLPKTRVFIIGNLTLKNEIYATSLQDPNSAQYKGLTEIYLPQLKNVYSTLNSFDILSITGFSAGSVIINFKISLNSNVSTADLANRTETLQNSSNSVITLETTGLVVINAPSDPVPYNSEQTILCTTLEDMKPNRSVLTNPDNSIFDITTGTDAIVTNTSRSMKVDLKQASEHWAGMYTCIFNPSFINVTIENKASAYLDIALLPPDIEISSNPQFPDCRSEVRVAVTVQCVIKNSTERYNVNWTGNNTESLNPPQNASGTRNTIIYSVFLSVSCNEMNPPAQTCTFLNRLNQNISKTINIPTIYTTSKFCDGDSTWKIAKAGNKAMIPCTPLIGFREKECTSGGIWGSEIANCVNPDLNDLLSVSLKVGSGLGFLGDNAQIVFSKLVTSTSNTNSINTYANLNASVSILSNVNDASFQANYTIKKTQLDDALNSSSNLLYSSLHDSWTNNKLYNVSNKSIAERYLSTVEGLVENSEINVTVGPYPHIELQSCQPSGGMCKNKVFNASVIMSSESTNWVKTIGFISLNNYLKTEQSTDDLRTNSIVVSTTNGGGSPTRNGSTIGNGSISINFQLIIKRPRNHEMVCVYWDFKKNDWSNEGCKWGGANNENNCICSHLSAFTILVSKTKLTLPYIDEITYAGISVSIVSLFICLVIECLVWSSVVKSNVSYCRHTAHINICLSLLIAHCSFLAASFPGKIDSWCIICVLLMHFCYLSMFFWMLCLSVMVLHQMIFVFHPISKKVCLGLSFFVGYICPLVTVFITFVHFNNGEKKFYYDPDTCWLIYGGLFQGSIFAFIMPVETIVLINVFCMVVVIMRLLRPSLENNSKDEKEVAKDILKAVVLLTPIFGGTWGLGLLVLITDLTVKPLAEIVNYSFTLLNAFQGFFILLTTYMGERNVRLALLAYFNKKKSQSRLGESSSKLSSSLKKN